MSVNADADVLIVGYGPVGQLLSLQLARKGWNVIVVERWPEAYPLPRAVHFDDEIGRILQSVGIRPDTSPVIDPYDDVYAWRNADQEDLLLVDWRGQGRSGWPTANFFSQPDLEAELHTLVLQEERISLNRGWEVVEVREDGDGVEVRAQRTHSMPRGQDPGRPQIPDSDADDVRTFRARYVVGADGARSFVREAMGVQMHDLGFNFDWLIVDMIPDEPMTFDPPAWQWCNPEHPTTIVPGGPGRRRWEFMRMPHETIEEMNTADYSWRRVGEWGLTPQNSRMERHAVYTFKAQWAESWRAGRLMLAGDAAHLMPPFAGQGMCAGMRDATNLSWRLDRVLSGASPEELLSSYGPERTSHVRYFINFSMGLGHVICITDPEAAAGRDAGMKAALADPSLAPEPEAPPHLAEGVVGFHDQAGFATPQGRVSDGSTTALLDDVVGNGWLVLSNRPELEQAISPTSRAWLEDNAAVVRVVGEGGLEDVDGTYADWFAELGAEAVVVRPDFYLYDAVPLAGLDQTLTRLREQLEGGAVAGGPVEGGAAERGSGANDSAENGSDAGREPAPVA